MSMLAERKRKTKWVINPRKKPLWTADSDGMKFSKELMEKMGWSVGKGLGVSEQGIQEPLQISYKNDTKGMGFKESYDDWTEQQDEFNELLSQLRNYGDVSNTDILDKEIKSLEEKSKQSKVRVHYQKFIRGKDLSKYTENDLACILGTNKSKKEKSKMEKVVETESKASDNCETSFGVTTINSGSLQDYFKKKWVFGKSPRNLNVENEEQVENISHSFSNSESIFDVKNEENLTSKKEEKKLKKGKHKSEEHNSETKIEVDILENFENNEKRNKNIKREENNPEGPKTKKRKKHCDDSTFISETVQEFKNSFSDVINYNKEFENLSKEHENGDINSTKKRRKNQNHMKLEDKNNSGCFAEVLVFEEPDEMSKNENILNRELNKKTKKKVFNKENNDVVVCQTAGLNQNDEKTTEFCLGIQPVKKKKKKESKEKSESNEKAEFCTTEAFVINSKKKKKKKDKKENFEEEEETEYKNYNRTHTEKELEEKNSVNGQEYEIMTESIKKKKKKKDKETKSINSHSNHIEQFCLIKDFTQKNGISEQENVEIKSDKNTKKKKNKREKLNVSKSDPVEVNSRNQNLEFNLEAQLKEKITNEVIIKTNTQVINSEAEAVISKEKKKKKKLNEEEINCSGFVEEEEESKEGINEQENIIEIKLNKEKKEKKNRKENENLNQINIHIDEGIKKSIAEVESVTKKEKKGKKEKIGKEILSIDCSETSNLEESSNEKCFKTGKQESTSGLELPKKKNILVKKDFCKPKATEKEKIHVQENIKKSNIEAVDNNIGFIYNNNSFHSLINSKDEEDEGVHKHKAALLNEKRADKFYPGGYDRVLRLALWTNIGGFKGSNLEEIWGYGQRKINEGNKFR